jgi:hypothetical protein
MKKNGYDRKMWGEKCGAKNVGRKMVGGSKD